MHQQRTEKTPRCQGCWSSPARPAAPDQQGNRVRQWTRRDHAVIARVGENSGGGCTLRAGGCRVATLLAMTAERLIVRPSRVHRVALTGAAIHCSATWCLGGSTDPSHVAL